jgi:hypothetical protein
VNLQELLGRKFKIETDAWRLSQWFFRELWSAHHLGNAPTLDGEMILDIAKFPVTFERRGCTSEKVMMWEGPQLRWFYKDKNLVAELHPSWTRTRTLC